MSGAAGAATGSGAVAASAASDGCGAPDQAAPLAGVDLERETVITGAVRAAATGDVVAGAYVRLLDASGEFAAEVVSSAEGVFRFFGAPGSWTVRALSRQGEGEATVAAGRGVNEVAVEVSS